jgi:hypothetical protein
VPSNGPSVHPTLLTSLLCFFQSSDASRNWTVGSSDGASWLEPSCSVPSTPTHTPMLVPRYRRFNRRCLLFSFLCSVWPLKSKQSSHFGMWYFTSLGPRNVYKDMLNNMFSSIDHVVMNLQNHTRTNGIWGHVRYNLPHSLLFPGAAAGTPSSPLSPPSPPHPPLLPRRRLLRSSLRDGGHLSAPALFLSWSMVPSQGPRYLTMVFYYF